MERRERSKFNTQIHEEACEWFIECRTSDLDETARSALDHWLRKSPEHVSAYLEVAAIWNEGPSLDPENKWDLDTLINQAAHDQVNVVTLSPGATGEVAVRGDEAWNPSEAVPRNTAPQPLEHFAALSLSPKQAARLPPLIGPIQSRLMLRAHSGASRWHLPAIAASIAILSLGIGALIWFVLLSTPTYATAIGEQRFIQLEDGSTVELNSRSKLSVHFSRHERDVKLLEGQALFKVTKDAARPFVVASGDATVRAVGTQFDVYKKENGTTVTVIEGRVAILTDHRITDAESLASTVDGQERASPSALPDSGGGQAPSILLSAGEQVTVTPKAVQMTERANVARATAWTDHQLLFEAASLTDVAHEFNRYNKRQLIVGAPQLDTFHISGVFSSTDPESLVRFLRERPGLRIVETDTEILIERNN